MLVYAGMNPRMPLADVAGYAERVERLGFDGLHVAEMIHDPFTASALALGATTSLRVRTAVALAFVRSPMATALAAWDLAHLSQGRFDLGLGSQVRANIEGRYGMAFDRPVGRMADHVGAIRVCFSSFESGEPPNFAGAFHPITRLQPDFTPEPLGAVRPPEVWLGAVGDQMVTFAGRMADGLITHPTNSHPVDLAHRLLPSLETGAAATDRAVPPVVVSPMIMTGADSEAIEAARPGVRRRMAFLYSTPAYRPTLDLLGLGHLGDRLLELTRQDRWDDLATVLDDPTIDRLVVTAPWPDLAAVVAERFADLAGGVVLRPPENPDDDAGFAPVVAALGSR